MSNTPERTDGAATGTEDDVAEPARQPGLPGNPAAGQLLTVAGPAYPVAMQPSAGTTGS